MNLLDENIPESQRLLLKRKRVPIRQLGVDVCRKGMQDDEIIAWLHQQDRPTFITLDHDFYQRRLLHPAYCLAYFDIEDDELASFLVRVLKHKELSTKAKRMGRILRVMPEGIEVWRVHESARVHLDWELSAGIRQ